MLISMPVLDLSILGFFVLATVTSFCVVPVRSSDSIQYTYMLDVEVDSISPLQTTLQVRPTLQESTEKLRHPQSNSRKLQGSHVVGRSSVDMRNGTGSPVELQEPNVAGQKLRETSHAIVTLACHDKWLMGALALGASLRKTGSRAALVLMISNQVSRKYDALVFSIFDHVYVISPVQPHPALVRSGANCVSMQLRIWQLPFKKVLYMDADMIALRNLDVLLERYGEFTAAKQTGHTQIGFNGGMFIAEPSLAKFQELQKLIASAHPTSEDKALTLTPTGLTGGMQVFLNSVFPSCEANGRPPERDDIVGCWSNQWLDPRHNKWDKTLTEREVRRILAADSRSQFFSSLHYAGGWEPEAKYTKPWESGCMGDTSFAYNASTSDAAFRQKLRMMALEVWMRAFEDVKAVDHHDILHVDCPYRIGTWSSQGI